MIEFNGYISGSAEKAFFSKSRRIVLTGYFVAILAILPMLTYVERIFQSKSIIYAFLGFFILIPLLLFIPKGKKERLAILPQRIYIDDNHIVCIADQYTDSKLISDVKKVVDHGDFYELSFPFGKLSEKFICQKSLLTKGSLDEFESLFAGKIVKRDKGQG